MQLLFYSTLTEMILKNITQNEQNSDDKVYRGVTFVKGKEGFVFGNCACKAISEAFNIDMVYCSFACRLLNLDYIDGLTFKECNFLIKKLGSIFYRNTYYKANKEKIDFIDFCKKNRTGTFILNMNVHLSLLKDGVVIDTFYWEKPSYITDLLGYWQIKNQFEY